MAKVTGILTRNDGSPAVFYNRTEAVRFAREARQNGIYTATVITDMRNDNNWHWIVKGA